MNAKYNNPPLETREINNTDLGNARRFARLHGKGVRYSHETKSWYNWNDRFWEQDKTGAIKNKAKDIPRQVLAEAAAAVDHEVRKGLARHGLCSESDKRLTAMLALAQSEPEIPILLKDFDTDLFLLNCRNGTIDLRTGELREHRQEDLITKLAPIVYNPQARSKTWEKFLERVLPNHEVRAFVQRFAGYSICGSVREEKFAFAFGPPATGKSTFLRAVTAALGDYAATADFEAFLVNKSSGGPRNDVARLAGKRFVISVEVEDGRKLAEGLVNQLTGGDTIVARYLYQESFEFVPQFKLWLAANNRPGITGTDGAIWRRVTQIPFSEHIPEGEQDPELKNVLCDPVKGGPAVLAWLVQGCLSWQKEGLNPPKEIQLATEEYKHDMDPLAGFLEEQCVTGPQQRVSSPEIWKAYQDWCDENSEQYPLGRKKFSQALLAKGYKQYSTGTTRIWDGVGLR